MTGPEAPGGRDELEDYLRDAMKDPEFRAAYERQARSDPWRMAGRAVDGALACLGASILQLAEGLRNFWRGGGPDRRLWIIAGTVFAAWAIWGLAWLIA